MDILLVAATEAEISPLLNTGFIVGDNYHNRHRITILITGVGMVATAYAMGKQLAKATYQLAINPGIAGSFKRSLALGDIVQVEQDAFAELGAEDGGQFIPIDTLGFGTAVQYPVKGSPETGLPLAKAITVNKVHGHIPTIKKTVQQYNPDIESMEGAAFFYACAQNNVSCVQVRAISNVVEQRNRDNWNIPLAIKKLNEFAITYLDQLTGNP